MSTRDECISAISMSSAKLVCMLTSKSQTTILWSMQNFSIARAKLKGFLLFFLQDFGEFFEM